jgi:two-component system OmpR family response regulator
MLEVLVVDDELAVRENLAAFLEDEGMRVTQAESGEQALETVAECRFQACVMDMRLPGMDGNAAILALYELQPDLHFLIHTGSVNYSLPPALRRLGMSEAQVFMKPLQDMGILADAIREGTAA